MQVLDREQVCDTVRLDLPDGVDVLGPVTDAYAEVLTREALAFVATLERAARLPREVLLRKRAERQARFDAGELPDFLPETADVRESEWKVCAIPADLRNRRVEITGPVDRKMVINALNSGADVFMADFEDATSPTWDNVIQGQLNLRDAVRRTITFTSPEGKSYRLGERLATLLVRPRGWHLLDRHVLVDGQPVAGGILDFGLYMFHNAHELVARGSGPYFYLPKLEGHREARLWNDLFRMAQEELGIPRGTIKATVLVETLPAAFEMDEILYELREHAAGLNAGRWDYIFSYIKKLRAHPDRVLPDRALVTMAVPFMSAYAQLLVKTCHRRNAYAIGGMSAFIPVKGDEAANQAAFAKVRADKDREAGHGYDGTWVAHPGLVTVAREAFDAVMDGEDQLHVKRDDVNVSAADLLAVPDGEISEAGLRTNISVGIQYIAAWLNGSGAVPLYNLMEDAATAEISRAQVWQWVQHPAGTLSDGRKVTGDLVREVTGEEMARLKDALGPERYAACRYADAANLFLSLVTADEFVEFLTLPGYELLED